eukprot:m.85910 g.85910  ORF g.85910 m.85910 type:complete len:718 (-) comp8258_c0_seq2:471-2624(-)
MSQVPVYLLSPGLRTLPSSQEASPADEKASTRKKPLGSTAKLKAPMSSAALEKPAVEMSIPRVNKCFTIFDEIIPQLGTYERAVKLVRDELYDAVFSEDYTACDGGRLQRVPFFEALRDLRRQRSEAMAAVTQQLEVAGARERELMAILESERARTAALADALASAEMLARSAQQEAASAAAELGTMRAQLARVNTELASEQQRAHAALESNRQTLDSTRAAVTELRHFKQDFVSAQLAFDSLTHHRSDTKRTVDGGARVVAKSEIAEMQKLLRQLCTLRARAIDDYDAAVGGKAVEPLPQVQRRFVADMTALDTDVSAIQQAIESLQQFSAEAPARAAEFSTKKFQPIEAVSHRYACVVLVSTDAKHFTPLPGSNNCSLCGGVSTICPHQPAPLNLVLPLPRGATHYKLTRPRLTIRHSGENEAATLQTPSEMKALAGNEMYTVLLRTHAQRPRVVLGDPRALAVPVLATVHDELFAWLKAEWTIRPTTLTLQENLYAFLERKYQMPQIATVVASDIFAGLKTHAEAEPKLDLFARMLCGARHSACGRYLQLVHELCEVVGLTHMAAFKLLVSKLFPFMTLDDMELFCFNFQAHCSNSITPAAVELYFVQLMRDRRDPRLLKSTQMLEDNLGRARGAITRWQFAAMATHYHLGDTFWPSLFDEAIRIDFDAKRDGIDPALPFAQCAEIVTHVMLAGEANTLRAAIRAAKSGDVTKR